MITTSSFNWDESLYNNIASPSSPFCNSIDTYPTSPNSVPYSNGNYPPSTGKFTPNWEPDLSFLGRSDHLLGQDDSIKSLLEPPSTALDSRFLPPDIDTTDVHLMPSISPEPFIDQSTISSGLDDTPISFEDSINQEPLFQNPQILPEITVIPPDEGLGSSPRSLKRSQPGYRSTKDKSYTPLTAAEECRLRSIAMPANPYPFSSISSPSSEPQDTRNGRARKSSTLSESRI